MFVHLTPAKGVVPTPMAALGPARSRGRNRDRDDRDRRCTRSLRRCAATPRSPSPSTPASTLTAAAPSSSSSRAAALFPDEPDREWLESITPQWEHFLGPRSTGLAGAWMSDYYWVRVPIVIEVERIVALDTPFSELPPTVYGAPLPPEPASQSTPKNGTRPRVGTQRVAADARRLPHTICSWAGGDGFPMAAEVRVVGASDEGIRSPPRRACCRPADGGPASPRITSRRGCTAGAAHPHGLAAGGRGRQGAVLAAHPRRLQAPVLARPGSRSPPASSGPASARPARPASTPDGHPAAPAWRAAGASGETAPQPCRRWLPRPGLPPASVSLRPSFSKRMHPPVLLAGDRRQRRVGIDRDRMPDRAQHRQIRGRVGVGEGLGEVDVVPLGEVAHRDHLALAVHERTVELARQAARRRRSRSWCRSRRPSRARAPAPRRARHRRR